MKKWHGFKYWDNVRGKYGRQHMFMFLTMFQKKQYIVQFPVLPHYVEECVRELYLPNHIQDISERVKKTFIFVSLFHKI